MLAKQFARASLQAVKASIPSVPRQSARVAIPACLKGLPSNQFNATTIRSISVTPLRLDQPPQSTPPSSNNQNSAFVDLPAVYLSNLSFAATEESLTEFLKEHTPVKKVDVVRNNDGAVRGFGFAKYATQQEAEAAVEVINGLNFLGRSIVAAISQRRPVLAEASNQLFMSGFPTQGEADEAALRMVLQDRLGLQPRAIRLHKFPGGFLKGTGHLEFDDIATVENVLIKLQELGPDKPIEVNGHTLSLVRARPLLQPRSRTARGGFGNMRGPPPAYGAPYAGTYGGFPAGSAPGYPPMGSYPAYPAPVGGAGYPAPVGGAGYPAPVGGAGYPAPVGGAGYPNQGYDNAYYPPPPPGSGGYGGYGSQGEGGQGSGAPNF